MKTYLWKALRWSKRGGIEVVGFFEAAQSSVLAGQTLTQYLGWYETEAEALAAHPEAEGHTTSKLGGPQVSVSHLSDQPDLY